MSDTRPAGFWIRAVAALADFGVFFLVQISFGYVAAKTVGPDVGDLPAFLPLVWAFTALFAGAYTTVLHAALGGQTLGKMLVGVSVVDVDGSPLSAGAALLRFLGYFASLAPLGLGFAMAGLRRDKRALHDLLAGSCVVRAARTARAVSARESLAPPSAG
jgi:uncharacterized RDD family membrane protein YckC